MLVSEAGIEACWWNIIALSYRQKCWLRDRHYSQQSGKKALNKARIEAGTETGRQRLRPRSRHYGRLSDKEADRH